MLKSQTLAVEEGLRDYVIRYFKRRSPDGHSNLHVTAWLCFGFEFVSMQY